MKHNLKKKLITRFTIVVVATGLIGSIAGTFLINQGVMNRVKDKVRNDLNTSRELLGNRIGTIRQTIHFGSIRNCIREAVLEEDRKSLGECLEQIREIGNMEILAVTDKNGIVIMRVQNPGVYGDDQSSDRIVSRVLGEREIAAAPVIVPVGDLRKEGEGFAERVSSGHLNSQEEKTDMKSKESSGIMIKAAAPMWSENGEFIGVLYGGDVLNGNFGIVDKIKDTVYRGEKYKKQDLGAVSIFQKAYRISTTFFLDDGSRGTGTRVSGEVYEKVFVKGESYTGRAFVVNSWFVTAYEPIKDVDGEIIGILGVGMFEQLFVDTRRKALLVLFGVTIIGMLVVILISNSFANTITKPVNYLVRTTRKISEGDFSVDVKVKSNDEIGELEKAFSSMATALQQRDEELKKQTQKQLMRSEKLSALGRMAAGVAHEINNPLTGVLMYSHFLLKRFPEGSQNRQDAEIIIKETTRCRDLVRNLLDFSRENIPRKELINVNELINKTISIIENQVFFEKVEFARELSEDLPDIMIDADQLEQVLINLSLNAAEAMQDGGKLTFETQINSNRNSVTLKIKDTGCGVPENDIDKIFDPFFTTKEVGKGTGLGLAVSYGIIKRHGGKINVESKVGSGTTFCITLPVEAVDVKE